MRSWRFPEVSVLGTGSSMRWRSANSVSHKCPVGVLNVNGYYDLLLAFIAHSVEVGFSSERFADLPVAERAPDELFRRLTGKLVLRTKSEKQERKS